MRLPLLKRLVPQAFLCSRLARVSVTLKPAFRFTHTAPAAATATAGSAPIITSAETSGATAYSKLYKDFFERLDAYKRGEGELTLASLSYKDTDYSQVFVNNDLNLRDILGESFSAQDSHDLVQPCW